MTYQDLHSKKLLEEYWRNERAKLHPDFLENYWDKYREIKNSSKNQIQFNIEMSEARKDLLK